MPTKNNNQTLKNKLKKTYQIVNQQKINNQKKIFKFIDDRPFSSFLSLLAVLLILIVVGNFLRKPPQAVEVKTPEPKLVETFSFNESPKLSMIAKVEKTGVINIVAQTPGIVQSVNVSEGEVITKGKSVVSLSTNYQGGNAASLSRQMAQKNYTMAVETFDTQKDIIGKQRELTNQGNLQAADMRSITAKSIDETRSAISLSENIIGTLDSQITTLESTNVGGVNDAAILGAKQAKSMTLSGLNQMRSGLRATEYQTASTNPPAEMADISKEITMKQLDLQERSLILTRDIAGINLKLAKVSEAMMFPATPFAGTVEKIFVRVGQNVNPGTVIATIKGNSGQNRATVLVTNLISRSVLTTEPSYFYLDDQKVPVVANYVSTEATDGNLYTVTYILPDSFDYVLTNSGSVKVEIPIGLPKIIINDPFVPLDAIYQTGDKAYVYVISTEGEAKKVITKEVTLGEVSGKYINVLTGLKLDDIVITTRTVQEGDLIRTE